MIGLPHICTVDRLTRQSETSARPNQKTEAAPKGIPHRKGTRLFKGSARCTTYRKRSHLKTTAGGGQRKLRRPQKTVEVMNTIVNKITLIGHLGNNPEVRTFDNGGKVVNLRLATYEPYRDAKGKKVDNTQWHDLSAWGKTAEFAEKYLAKGKYVVAEGRLVHRSYEDKDGNKRYATEVRVSDFMMLDKKEEAA